MKKSNKINEKLPVGYILLWSIVILISIFMLIRFFSSGVNTGTWECVEYKVICGGCETRIGGEKVHLELLIKDTALSENDCKKYNCLKYDQKCIKEVWTKNQND